LGVLAQFCGGEKRGEKERGGGECSGYGEGIGVYRFLVGKREGKRPMGRSRRRWVDNIKMDLKIVGWGHGLD